MKTLTLLMIRIYQIALSPFQVLFPTTGCRFYPTCSTYTHSAVEKYGVVKGLRIGAARVIKCNPWN